MQTVYYLNVFDQLACGIVAEVFDSPLTGKKRVRIVDAASEAADPEAGITLYADEVADDPEAVLARLSRPSLRPVDQPSVDLSPPSPSCSVNPWAGAAKRQG